MGCVSSKGFESEDDDHHGKRGRPGKSLKRLVASSKKDEAFVVDGGRISNNGGGRERLISNTEEIDANPPVPVAVAPKDAEERVGKAEGNPAESKPSVTNGRASNIRVSSVPNGFVAEHVAAGWPSWLTNVAGEAVRGWLPRKADSFERLYKIGQGTYSNVYKARDLETGKIVALKKVRFVNMDAESVRFMAREIYILRRLDHPNVVKLESLITSRTSCSLYLVFEYMEHDLAGLAATPSIKFTEPQVKCYMQQLLTGLNHCHIRGVLHRDIKGANLLIDNNGILKIADFGLATFFNPDQKQPLTSRVVTLWYRPPELLLGATEYDVAVDLWSTGCILAELLAGSPIMPGRTEVEQLHKIFKLCGSPSDEFWRKSKLPNATIFKPQQPYKRRVSDTFRDFPPTAISLLECLLAIEPANRGTTDSALNSEFFTTVPFACDPSSLPKYPPSKELDAKLRDEEARRNQAAVTKGNGSESGRNGSTKREPMPETDAYADLLNGRVQENPKSITERYNSQDGGGTRFQIEHPNVAGKNGFIHSGISGSAENNKVKNHDHSSSTLRAYGQELKPQRSYMPQVGSTGLSNLSGFVATRSSSIKLDKEDTAKHQHWPEHRSTSRYNKFDIAEASVTHNLLDRPSFSHKKGDIIGNKDPSAMGYVPKKNRIHYSGPLMPPGGNFDEMLKEHERQIQQAVRNARDKAKSKSYIMKGQSEAHLYVGSSPIL
ncbi:putative serine/threonine-protein kinase [Iris pallida]|uniref:[RNA-polymerase]-subunit kinase n=1 Tax=Iris pallida TaxID=29817 RepID=A0AAX6DUB1_IRIPA|nr:putative serine/threonine-protein kinase [Iris pallida]